MNYITIKINGLHYSYCPEDAGNVGIFAVCDETNERVILKIENGHFTGDILSE